jgi:hypothetical protein
MVAFSSSFESISQAQSNVAARHRSGVSTPSTCSKSDKDRPLREVTYEDTARLESCSKDPIGFVDGLNDYQFVNCAPVRYVDSNGKEAEDVTMNNGKISFTYSAQDLDDCETKLRRRVTLGRLGGAACAADLLERFLDKSGGSYCPTSCKLALESASIPPNGCMRSFLQASTTCPGSGTVPLNLSGSTSFEDWRWWYGFAPTVDLSYGLGQVGWSVTGMCSTSCTGTMGPPCCCSCDARCNYTLSLVNEDFDFCSSLKEGDTNKFSLPRCACALENSGRGKKYKVNCKVQKSGHLQRRIDMCGQKVPNPGTCGRNVINNGSPTQ